jgi:type VI protein secretion system component VasF
MNSVLVRFVCRLLVVCMAVLPFQAGAGMVGTGEAVAAAQSSAAVRAALAAQLQTYGVAGDTARERIAALSDSEVLELAGQMDRLPAGANAAGIGALLVILFLLWRFGFSQQGKAAEPARK